MRSRLSVDKIQLFSYFLLVSGIGSLLLSMPFAYKSGIPVPYIDALFTSMSATCVTGLSTLPMDIYSVAGFITIMCIIEFGGLGLVSFISLYIIVPQRKISLVNRAVIRDFFIDDVETEPRRILRSILFFTLAFEGVCAFIMFFAFKGVGSEQPALDALFHSVSAFCNAGFSTYNDSLWEFRDNYVILGTVMLLIVVGGIGFTVLTDVFRSLVQKNKRLAFHSKCVLIITTMLLLSGALIFFFFERTGSMKGLGIRNQLLLSLFQSVTPRTAGFSAIPQSMLTPISKLITMVLMFIGGSPGSIAGGVKTTTMMIIVVYAIRGNTDRRGLNVMGRNLDTPVIEKAFSIVGKSIIIVLVSLSALLISENQTLLTSSITIFDLTFEVISAFGTVGLSLGVTEKLTVIGKVIIISTMFIGRTGIFAMAIGFAQNERERFFEYPSANVLVG